MPTKTQAAQAVEPPYAFDPAAQARMFDPAMQVMNDAMRAGVRMQGEIARWWSDVLPQGAGQIQEWQKRSQAMFDTAFPVAQKNMQNWMRVLEQNYRRAMDLMKKAMETDSPANAREAQDRAQQLFDASVAMIRENAQAMAEANFKTMELWAEFMRKNAANFEKQ